MRVPTRLLHAIDANASKREHDVRRVGLMAMSNTDFEAWGRLRRMGRVRFVLGIGVLGFGVPFALLFSLFFCLVVWAMGDPRPPLWWFVLIAALSLLGGLAFGFWQWYTSERAYRRQASSGSDAKPADD